MGADEVVKKWEIVKMFRVQIVYSAADAGALLLPDHRVFSWQALDPDVDRDEDIISRSQNLERALRGSS